MASARARAAGRGRGEVSTSNAVIPSMRTAWAASSASLAACCRSPLPSRLTLALPSVNKINTGVSPLRRIPKAVSSDKRIPAASGVPPPPASAARTSLGTNQRAGRREQQFCIAATKSHQRYLIPALIGLCKQQFHSPFGLGQAMHGCRARGIDGKYCGCSCALLIAVYPKVFPAHPHQWQVVARPGQVFRFAKTLPRHCGA